MNRYVKPNFALIIPMLSPKFPVEPTAIEYLAKTLYMYHYLKWNNHLLLLTYHAAKLIVQHVSTPPLALIDPDIGRWLSHFNNSLK